MRLLIRLVANTLAVYAAAKFVPGIEVDSFVTALLVSIVLGILNTFIKPFLVILTLPINIITLGLFTLVINALLVLLTASIVSGFIVTGVISAILFSIVLSIVSAFLSLIAR